MGTLCSDWADAGLLEKRENLSIHSISPTYVRHGNKRHITRPSDLSGTSRSSGSTLSFFITLTYIHTEFLTFTYIYTEGEKASYRNRDRYRYSDRETLSHSQGKHRKRAIKNRRRGFRSAIEGGGKGGGGLGGGLGDGGLARGAALPRAFNCQRQKLSQVSALVLVLCPVTT